MDSQRTFADRSTSEISVFRSAVLLFETGDHLSQREFHTRYELMPESVKAELIGGIVYMQTSLKRSHGRSHSLLMHWLRYYEDETPGLECYDNA